MRAIFHDNIGNFASQNQLMKPVLKLILMMAIAAFASCKQKERIMSKAEIKAKADSLIGIRLDELNKQAMEDLEKRQTIEVKTKADSIVEAYIKSQDSAR